MQTVAFNRGRFNRSVCKDTNFSGAAAMGLFADGKMNAANAFAGGAAIAILAFDTSFDGAIIGMRAGGQITRTRILGEMQDATRQPKFNRMGFNRGKFNASAHIRSLASVGMSAQGNLTAIRGMSGAAEIEIAAQSGILNTSSTLEGAASVLLAADGQVIAARTFEGSAEMAMAAEGFMNWVQNFSGAAAFALEATSQEFNTFTISYIHLPGLVLRPGDELIIDTDAKTILHNGENAMRHLNRHSEFFNFHPRENEVVYTSNNADARAQMRVLWKDAWV